MTKPVGNKLQDRLNDAGRTKRPAAGPAAPATAPEASDEAPPAPVVLPANRRKGQWDKKMQRWTCYVDKDVLRRMHAYADETGVPRSQIATEGIALWLQQHGAE
jgi:hypothetical protein